ncbi:MAG: Sir2 family NAD-dependent protein deacetylase [Bacteroidales bacterium]
MKKIVVFTGAGVSADSGIATFRDSDGLWANHKIEEVCTEEALGWNRDGVIDFYNMRRKELLEKEPNPAHWAIAELEAKYEVEVITQNIDDLHERAGSSHITHLHGELKKLRSIQDPQRIYSIENWDSAVESLHKGQKNIDDLTSVWKQEVDTKDPYGDLLRPYVVFFGESVPMFDIATHIASTADIFIVVGTSLAVYPAAALIYQIRPEIPVYLVDPKEPTLSAVKNKVKFIPLRAAEGMPKLVSELL